MDLLIGSRRLTRELIAGNIKDLQTLIVELLVDFLEILILRRKPASGCCIDDQHDLSRKLLHR